MWDDLPERLAHALRQGPRDASARHRFAPQLAYARHTGPAAFDARSAAVVILLYPRQEQWWIPLTVRQPHLADHAGQVSLPGGTLEAGERSEMGALRELAEELGVAEPSPRLIGSLTPLYVFNSNFLVTPWLACLTQPPTLSPQADEVAEVFELPLTALLNESNFARIEIQRGALRYSAPCIRFAQYCIWGATSMILAEFRDVAAPRGADLPWLPAARQSIKWLGVCRWSASRIRVAGIARLEPMMTSAADATVNYDSQSSTA